MSKEDYEVRVEKSRQYGVFSESTHMYCKTAPIAEAAFAMSLIEKWGLVMGKDGGEDSSGRAKLTLMPVNEVVERAFQTADAVFAEIRRRDWLMEMPVPRSPEEVEAEHDEKMRLEEVEREAKRLEKQAAKALTS